MRTSAGRRDHALPQPPSSGRRQRSACATRPAFRIKSFRLPGRRRLTQHADLTMHWRGPLAFSMDHFAKGRPLSITTSTRSSKAITHTSPFSVSTIAGLPLDDVAGQRAAAHPSPTIRLDWFSSRQGKHDFFANPTPAAKTFSRFLASRTAVPVHHLLNLLYRRQKSFHLWAASRSAGMF